MCKVLMFTNTTKVTDFKRLVSVAASALKTQRDGFGYAAMTESFELFGERTNDVNEFRSVLEVPSSGLPFTTESEVQNSFGTVVGEKIFSAIFHGRISTNNKALLNVHPITNDNGWALIHNGVVSNHGPKYTMKTDNDSEHVLHNFSEGGIKQLAANLTGYYAFGAFDKLGQLHVVRDSIAKLYACRVASIDSIVYGTTKELIKDVCSSMGFTGLSSMALIKNDTYILHKVDGSFEWSHFDSRGRDEASTALSSLSLGYQLPSMASAQTQSYSSFDDYWNKPRNTLTELVERNRSAAKGSTISSRERKSLQNDLIAACRTAGERLGLEAFFKYINSSKNTYYIIDTFGREVDRKEFLKAVPLKQVEDYDVVSDSGVQIEPFVRNSLAGGF